MNCEGLRFWVFTAVTIKIQVFSDVRPCWLVNCYHHFGESDLRGEVVQESYSFSSAYRSLAAIYFIIVCSIFFSKDFSFTEESQY